MKNKGDRIVKRNWKKIGIWSTVGAAAIVGITLAIYYPIVLNQDHGPAIPSNLNVVDVDETIDIKNSKGEDELWGLFVADKDEYATDFALYGMGREDEGFEDEFNGPFGEMLVEDEKVSDEFKLEWHMLTADTLSEAQEDLARILLDDEQIAGTGVTYNFTFHGKAEQTDTHDFLNVDDLSNETITAKWSEVDDEDVWTLESSNDAVLEGPMWIVFEGDEVRNVISGIDTNDATAVTGDDFVDWVTEILHGGYSLPAPVKNNKLK